MAVIGLDDIDPKERAFKIIGDVQKLNVEPNDVIVIMISKDLRVSAAECDRVIEMWKASSGLPNKTVCFMHGLNVKVVSPK